MSTLIAHSESVRRAFAYITEERAEHPERSVSFLLDEAGSRFNLGPQDCDALGRLVADDPHAVKTNAATMNPPRNGHE